MTQEGRLLGELLPLAYYYAHKYEYVYRQPKGEFETAAMMGAWDAIKKYDPTNGANLKTYARQRIRGEIIDWHRKELQQKGGSRIEANRNLHRCVDFTELGTNSDGRSTDAAIIERMEQGRTCEKGFDEVENKDLIEHLKARMDAKEWDIMYRCVCNEEYMKDVGKDYGISESRICQILPVALKHARKIIEDMDLPGEAYESGMDWEDMLEKQWMRSLDGQG